MKFLYRLQIATYYSIITLATVFFFEQGSGPWPRRDLASVTSTGTCAQFTRDLLGQRYSWSQKEKDIAYSMMLSGSRALSRTITAGRRFEAPLWVGNARVAPIAERNFIKAANYMIDHMDDLGVNLGTAIKLNKILTEQLVGFWKRGHHLYRIGGSYVDQTDSFVDGDPRLFYRWLDSKEAQELHRRDPVAFAEIIHNNIVALDSFPDGNGRLSRLLADLALMQQGRAPAYYTSMDDYFARGNARSDVDRSVRRQYFREVARRGQRVLDRGEVLQID